MGEFGTGSDREGCPWRLARCSAKLAEESTDYYGSVTGITGPSPVYAAGQPFPGAGWFLYRLNLDDESAVAYIEEMIPLRCAFALRTQKTVDPLTQASHPTILAPSPFALIAQVDWRNGSTEWIYGGKGHGHAPAGLGWPWQCWQRQTVSPLGGPDGHGHECVVGHGARVLDQPA